MYYLIIGLSIFFVAHLQKRLIPSLRAKIFQKIGENGYKGIIALLTVIGLVLIIIGYRLGDFIFLYDFGSWGLILNNITMMFAVAFLGLGHSKSRFRKYVRHPMLLSIIFWSVSHLIANGDLKSVILFLSFGLWSFSEIILINRSEIHVQTFTGGSLKEDIRFLLISTLAYFFISITHLYFGVSPFY